MKPSLNLDEILRLENGLRPTPDADKMPVVVVRLSTSVWNDCHGMYIKRTLRYLLRQCRGFNVLDEDCGQIGAEFVYRHIVNINTCEDGIYEVVLCNQSSSWETPHIIEDYDYKLIPYKPKEKLNEIPKS